MGTRAHDKGLELACHISADIPTAKVSRFFQAVFLFSFVPRPEHGLLNHVKVELKSQISKKNKKNQVCHFGAPRFFQGCLPDFYA